MMNHCVPDFEMGDDDYSMTTTTTSSLTKASGEDEIMELLWQNNTPIATIIPHNRQSRSRSPKTNNQSTAPPPPPPPQQQPSNHLYMAEDEMASWLHYPLEDFYSEVLYTNNNPNQAVAAPPPPPDVERVPPRCPAPQATAPGRGFPLFSRLRGQNSSEILRSESSGLTRVDSSKTPPSIGPPSVAASVVVTSSSPTAVAGVGESLNVVGGVRGWEGGMESPSTASGSATSSATLVAAAADTAAKDEEEKVRRKEVGDRKRKGRELDESFAAATATTSEPQTDQDAELESADDKKHSGRGSTGMKRSRAAEVHNLSERRRRDRINEKMKALQELIPRCNKTDKASMLDEAIDYLKSLQMQVQMMSMGCGMVPMMYPGIQQQYMPPMGMGMGMGVDPGMAPRAVMPFAHPANMAPRMAPRLPLPTYPAPPLHPPSFPGNQTSNQADSSRGSYVVQSPAMMQHPNIVDPYQQYLAFQQMQMQMQMQAAQNQGLSQPGSSKPTSSKDEGDR